MFDREYRCPGRWDEVKPLPPLGSGDRVIFRFLPSSQRSWITLGAEERMAGRSDKGGVSPDRKVVNMVGG